MWKQLTGTEDRFQTTLMSSSPLLTAAQPGRTSIDLASFLLILTKQSLDAEATVFVYCSCGLFNNTEEKIPGGTNNRAVLGRQWDVFAKDHVGTWYDWLR